MQQVADQQVHDALSLRTNTDACDILPFSSRFSCGAESFTFAVRMLTWKDIPNKDVLVDSKCFCEINNSCVIIIVQVPCDDNDQTQATEAQSLSLQA